MSPQEAQLAAIWANLLGREDVGPEDNFFDLGGHSVLVAALQQRVLRHFGKMIPMVELFHFPTIRQQAEMLHNSSIRKLDLPPGVFALQPSGNRRNLFWTHSMDANLAKEFGEDQPFLFVTLTPEDVAALGTTPTFESVASYHLRKIIATQPEGPYMIGGLCVGSIVAFEIATQLKDAGHEVSLLVMLDAPNPTYIQTGVSFSDRLSQFKYFWERGKKLGLGRSFTYLSERVQKRFARFVIGKSPKTEMRVAQELIEAAAISYRPRTYDGKVLLLLTSERPSHVNFLPGWLAVVPHGLQAQFVNTHHRDLMQGDNVRSVAEVIAPHLNQDAAKSP